MRGRFSIRTLLLGAHVFVWLIPVFALFGLRLLDVVLLRQTEHQLIAESVVIGEMYRAARLAEDAESVGVEHPPSALPSHIEPPLYTPIAAHVSFDDPILPPQEKLTRSERVHGAASSAGMRIEPVLKRAQTFNLSAIRVLDERGCVVATTRGEEGMCMQHLPEVAAALSGRYASVLRERVSDEPPPPFGDLRRRGKVRVFTALPLFAQARVIGVVRASRTGRDAVSSLWDGRRWLVWSGASVLALLLLMSLGSAAVVVRPLQRLTRSAQAVSEGAPASTLAISGSAPREVVQLQAVLVSMAERLAQRASYVQDFASQVSHELKTPITAIRGASELLSQAGADMTPVDRARFVHNILEDALRMERLVTRLLMLARLENAPLERTRALDVGPTVQRCLSRYAGAVDLILEPALGHLEIGEEALASVLLNLVENALRHRQGQPVSVRVSREGRFVRIDVRDRGPGVSEANRRRLFERFFTTERDAGGTGLGLAIVRAIAESRGGRAFASFDEQGSTFTALL